MMALLMSLALAATPRWSEPVRAQLEAMLAEAEPARVAVFDWDNTCIRGDVGESLLSWLDAQDQGNRQLTYEALCAAEGPVRCYAWGAAAIAGLTPEEAEALGREVIAQGLATGTIEERPEVIALMGEMRARGWEVWVVSASPEPIVRVAAARYDVPADKVIGVRLARDVRGRFVGELAEPLTYRAGKVWAIQHHIGKTPFFAAGDAMTDLEMLASARHALVFDRGHEELLRHAHRLGWWIQEAW